LRPKHITRSLTCELVMQELTPRRDRSSPDDSMRISP
jgi:hypothetical protein